VQADELSRSAVDALLAAGHPRLRAAAYLQCVRVALDDHALTSRELATLRHLRTALAIEDGALLSHDREAVATIVAGVLAHLLVDAVITEEEGRYKVAVQESLSLAYDDFLALGWTALAAFLDQLDAEGTGLSPDQLATFERRAMHLGSVFHFDVSFLVEQPTASRHVPQHVKDAVWRRDGGRCALCESREWLEFDHIIPFSRGGPTTYRNIQLLCQTCNRRKSDSTVSAV
jgi:hypothetical protein